MKMSMRRKTRDYDNLYYLGFVDHYIERLFTEKRQDILQYMEKHMEPDEYKDFMSIASYVAAKKLAELNQRILYRKAEEKSTKPKIEIIEKKDVPENAPVIPLTPEISKALNDTMIAPAKKEWDDYFAFIKIKDEVDAEHDKFINGFDQVRFLQVISKFQALLTTFKQHEQGGNLSRLISSWKAELEEVQVKTKNKNKGEQTKEMLRIILGPKVDDPDAIAKEVEKEKERYGKRLQGLGHMAVNLDEEMDVTKLTRGDYFIETLALHGHEGLNIVEEHSKIHINVNGEPTTPDLREYYDSNKSKISKELLTSNDLLDNILIVYAIKRAQNGDDEASELLYKCYEETAEKVGVNFIRTKAEGLQTKGFSASGEFSYEEVKEVAKRILRLLLTGDNPYLLLKYLGNNDEKPDVDLFLNRRIHTIFLETYNNSFLTILSILKVLAVKMKDYKKQLKNLTYRAKKATKPETKKHYYVRIFQLAQHEIHAVETYAVTASIGFDPHNLIVYSRHFNSSVYYPNKKSNLTTWLFGSGKYKGMLWQKLNDWYKSKTYTESGKRKVKAEDYSQPKDVMEVEQKVHNTVGSVDDLLSEMEQDRENWSF